MSSNNVPKKSFTKTVATIGLIVLAVMVLKAIPKAEADPVGIDPTADRSFIAQIKTAGVPVADNEEAIVLALSGCEVLANDPSTGIVEAVGGILHNEPTLTRQQAAKFLGAGVKTYCPERANQLGLSGRS
ncbi:DUF732 domain-containing protein [Mycolicibacterium farcinogenes]|uniref:DUF732 domain-containing protein n=1 Tax=Mycolicibacterium farcinogenes TaxID=1802 RepID=A0ACD1FD99_MYCFR|nr:DUF732 domain-containing protein [Mycolicibacterium farcinogenes]QZH65049.1 DUF732 domain-containing protein [Mycolicibacterium farcinogenes]